MNNCCLNPKGIQSHCREERLWLNRIIIEYDNSEYIAKFMLYTSYRSKRPKEILIKSYTDKKDIKAYILELWSLYPRLDIGIRF